MRKATRKASGALADWAEDAACKGKPIEWFFPVGEDGNGAAPAALNARAKAICATCEVTAECLGFALRTGQRYGIWGGLDVDQRRRVQRRVG